MSALIRHQTTVIDHCMQRIDTLPQFTSCFELLRSSSLYFQLIDTLEHDLDIALILCGQFLQRTHSAPPLDAQCITVTFGAG